MVRREGVLFVEAESRVLGVTHARIGSWLAERWNFPRDLADAVACHHTPHQAQTAPILAAIVHYANYLTRRAGIGNSGDQAEARYDPDVAQTLDLRRTETGEAEEDFYLQAFSGELEHAEMFINLVQGGAAAAPAPRAAHVSS